MEDLDAIDRKILDLLQRDARTTNKELSAELGLSVTPVHARVKRLEKTGYIRRYVALVDPRKVGRTMTVYCLVSLKEHSQASVGAFNEAVQGFSEVMACDHVTGRYDFLLKVMVADMEGYQAFVLHKLGVLDNIAHVQSLFSLSTVKQTTAFPMG